ncbi:dUTPase [Bacillus cereus]|nr:dUTPase [Bacillus cereus]
MNKKSIDLSELFKMQKALDQDIKSQHPQNYKDRVAVLEDKVYALKVEIHEAWNDTRGFKRWSTRYKVIKASFLEEMIDSLHFVLSIAIEYKLEKDMKEFFITPSGFANVNKMFFFMDKYASHILNKVVCHDVRGIKKDLLAVLDVWFKIVRHEGYTFDDVVRAYKEKNEENLNRLAVGY